MQNIAGLILVLKLNLKLLHISRAQKDRQEEKDTSFQSDTMVRASVVIMDVHKIGKYRNWTMGKQLEIDKKKKKHVNNN